ncbi:MAG: cupin domain-containing protein [Pseudomonadota bacterium]
MELNADFDSRAIVHGAKTPWIKSPMPGVDRRMLDRLGDEVARATSIVRYAPESHFSPHVHTGGEEFLVLDGVFQDEHGDFPTGTYVRNPPQSSHTPGSEQGCTIFVKLWQFDMDDRTQIVVQPGDMVFQPTASGVRTAELFRDANEHVVMEHWDSGTPVDLDAPGGMEVLVTEGSFELDGELFEPQSWLRLPAGGSAAVSAGADGAKVWIKRGHLTRKPQPPTV